MRRMFVSDVLHEAGGRQMIMRVVYHIAVAPFRRKTLSTLLSKSRSCNNGGYITFIEQTLQVDWVGYVSNQPLIRIFLPRPTL